jgi:hypothetical protein
MHLSTRRSVFNVPVLALALVTAFAAPAWADETGDDHQVKLDRPI